jgi:rubredoxin
MVTVQGTHIDRRRKPFIVDGRKMRCPRCKKPHDILEYVPLMQIADYACDTVPIYKCPKCRWIFAPAPAVTEIFKEVMENGQAG